MRYISQKLLFVLLLPFVSLCLVCSCQSAHSKSTAVELLQYLNPLPKKGYVNESQDRLIKKRSFQVSDFEHNHILANKELGFFACIHPDKLQDTAYLEQLLCEKHVSGLSVLIPWQKLEPEEDQFNWQIINQLLALCTEHKKSLILRVATSGADFLSDTAVPSFATPAWVQEAGAKAVTLKDCSGKQYFMPVVWDANYLAKWSNFIKALGKSYDGHSALHSVGITGGGFAGGTSIIPISEPNIPSVGKQAKSSFKSSLLQVLKKEHGMNQRQLIGNWKYIADIFLNAFPTTHLNFDITPPTPNRAGEDALDEITDYLAYRYGERVYLNRHHIKDSKHGFDDYRLLLKFRNDTMTGLSLSLRENNEEVLQKIVRHALDDGISFAEMSPEILLCKDSSTQQALNYWLSHIGFQLVSQKAEIAKQITSGEPLPVTFSFLNLGATALMRGERHFDKNVPASYKIQIELRDAVNKPLVQSLHTPKPPTYLWKAGSPINWQENLKLPKLATGEYSVWMSLIDPVSKRQVWMLNACPGQEMLPVCAIYLGKVSIVSNSLSTAPATQLGQTQ